MIYKFLFLSILISVNVSGQNLQSKNNSAFLFVDSIFIKEKIKVQILDLEFPKDVQEIAVRFQKNLVDKKEWFEQYFSKNYKEGEGLPYHENFGVTLLDYQKIKNLQQTPPNRVIKDSALLKVLRNSAVLSFEAIEPGARFFEALQIDLKTGIIKFINDTIPYFEEINSKDSSSNGNWRGYYWKKIITNLEEKDDLKIDSLISKIVEIDFEKSEDLNKIFFHLKYKEVNRGEIIANFDVMCYLE